MHPIPLSVELRSRQFCCESDSCLSVFTRRDHHQITVSLLFDRPCSCVGSCIDESVLAQAGPLWPLLNCLCSIRSDIGSLCWRLSVSSPRESARPRRIQGRYKTTQVDRTIAVFYTTSAVRAYSTSHQKNSARRTSRKLIENSVVAEQQDSLRTTRMMMTSHNSVAGSMRVHWLGDRRKHVGGRTQG